LNRNSLVWIGGALLPALTLVGCNRGGGSSYTPKPVKAPEAISVKPGNEMELFPLKNGATWVYAVAARSTAQNGETRSAEAEITFKATDVVPDQGGVKAKIEISQGAQVTEVQTWRVDPTGIYQLTSGAKQTPFNPPQLAFKFPFEERMRWEWKGDGGIPGGEKGMSTMTGASRGIQECDTAMGRMQAVAIETRWTWGTGQKQGGAVSTTWWKPGVGIVRFRQEIGVQGQTGVQLFRLKSYTPGK